MFKRPARQQGSARLIFEQIVTHEAGPLDCHLRAGEVVGFVGLRGAGQESIGRALFGIQVVDERLRQCGVRREGSFSSLPVGRLVGTGLDKPIWDQILEGFNVE